MMSKSEGEKECNREAQWTVGYYEALSQTLRKQGCMAPFVLSMPGSFQIMVAGTTYVYKKQPEIRDAAEDILSAVRMISVPFFVETLGDFSLQLFVDSFPTLRYFFYRPQLDRRFNLTFSDKKGHKCHPNVAVSTSIHWSSCTAEVVHDPQCDRSVVLARLMSLMLLATPFEYPIMNVTADMVMAPRCTEYDSFFTLGWHSAPYKSEFLEDWHTSCRFMCRMNMRSGLHDYFSKMPPNVKKTVRLEECILAIYSAKLDPSVNRETDRALDVSDFLATLDIAEEEAQFVEKETRQPVGAQGNVFFYDFEQQFEDDPMLDFLPDYQMEAIPYEERPDPLMYTGEGFPCDIIPRAEIKAIQEDSYVMSEYCVVSYGPSHAPTFCCYWSMGDNYSCGYGRTRHEAMDEAAFGILLKHKFGKYSPLYYHRKRLRLSTKYRPYVFAPTRDDLRGLVGSALFIINVQGEVAMISERKGKPLNFPGGSREKGETPMQTLQREISEEAPGLEVPWQSLNFFVSVGEGACCFVFVWDCRKAQSDPQDFRKYFTMVDFSSINSYGYEIAPYCLRVIDHFNGREYDKRLEQDYRERVEGPLLTPNGLMVFQGPVEMREFFATWQRKSRFIETKEVIPGLKPQMSPFG